MEYLILIIVVIYFLIVKYINDDETKLVVTPEEKPVQEWNIITQIESEYGIWDKKGDDIPTNEEIFIASPITQKDENGNKIVITRWIKKEDAIKSIYNVFNKLGEN